MIKRILKGISHPSVALRYFISVSHLFDNMEDEAYIRLLWRIKFLQKLNLDNPQGYNEKLQWLKLYDHNPAYTQMVDKYLVKPYVAGVIGEEYIIPTLGVWDKPEDIDFSSLPQQFVLKTNHTGGGGGVIICRDKSKLNQKAAIQKMTKSMMGNVYKELREWPYKNIEKKIIAERYMEDDSGNLNDYKVLCFSGKAKLIEYHANRFEGHHTQDFYDCNWNKTAISQGGVDTRSEIIAPKPITLGKMLEFSEVLTKNMPHCRVDWYEVKGKLYFGELTFYDSSGFDKFDRKEDEQLLGSWIDLSMCYKGE